MKVLKAINNNVVSCLDDNGKELVVMGKGLGFSAKPGEKLDYKLVEKVFRMDSPEEFTRLKDLFARLPADLLEVCSQIIDHANQVTGRRLNESVYLTLTDHIQFAIQRCRQGVNLQNPLATEVRVFYPKEFSVGQYALKQIWQEQGVTLPEDEAASIALHIVNAEFDSSMNLTMRAAQVLQPMAQIIGNWPGLRLNKQHLYYDELIVHLKFMAMQAFRQEQNAWADGFLAETVQKNIPEACACAQAVCSYLTEQSGNEISASEQAFLAICICRACM